MEIVRSFVCTRSPSTDAEAQITLLQYDKVVVYQTVKRLKYGKTTITRTKTRLHVRQVKLGNDWSVTMTGVLAVDDHANV